jgi:hypothetical protein
LWANDSTKENITLAYSEIWLIIYKKERRGKRRGGVFFLREGGVRLGLAVEEGERLGFCDELACRHTSPSVSGFQARHARNKRHWSVCIRVQFLSSGKGECA